MCATGFHLECIWRVSPRVLRADVRPAKLQRLAYKPVVQRSTKQFRCHAEQQASHWYTPDAHSMDDFIQMFHEKKPETDSQQPGVVYLVGTGPGDPGLLTMKAGRILQNADVVLYDRLVSEDILGLINPNAVMVYVGKQRSFHTRTQPEIHDMLKVFAKEGALVVRLKGGDPYIFGRGGEEVEYLEQHGVNVQVVPGITAAAGISAELGIPLTHRGLATSVRFLTGHARDGGQAELDAAVATAVDPYTTLVVYMGLATLPRLSTELITGGLPADTPAVAVERGTTIDQRTVYAPLNELSTLVEEHQLKSPTLILIGKVVSLSPGWKASREHGNSFNKGEESKKMSGGQLLDDILKKKSDKTGEGEFTGSGWRMLE